MEFQKVLVSNIQIFSYCYLNGFQVIQKFQWGEGVMELNMLYLLKNVGGIVESFFNFSLNGCLIVICQYSNCELMFI